MNSKILIVIGLVCFVLATFGVALPHVQLLPLGLVFVTAATLV